MLVSIEHLVTNVGKIVKTKNSLLIHKIAPENIVCEMVANLPYGIKDLGQHWLR